jgi:hypothetical protein
LVALTIIMNRILTILHVGYQVYVQPVIESRQTLAS